MSKYYKAEDVIRKRAEDLADTSYWEYGNPKNVDEWIEVAEMEFKDLPTIEVSEDDLYIPLNNQTVKRINRLHKDECGEYFDDEWLFNELEQISEFREVSEDCISREYILGEAFASDEYNRETKSFDLPVVSVSDIENAPSVVPSRAEGEWIERIGGISKESFYQCSKCYGEVDTNEFDYCPWCGAKMKG